MTIFNKCHAVFVGFLAFIIVTTVGYTINQGDFFQNEYLFIIAKTFWISLSVAYAKKVNEERNSTFYWKFSYLCAGKYRLL